MKFEDLFTLNHQILEQGLVWNQGPGGNISFKDGSSMYIKPSGMRLDQLHSLEDMAIVDWKKLSSNLKKINIDEELAYAEYIHNSSLTERWRPSMEAGFHTQLPAPIVLHFHSLTAILMAEFYFNKNAIFNEWLKKNSDAKGSLSFLPQYVPGLKLYKAIEQRKKSTPFLVLQNHGVIIQVQQISDLALYQELENDFLNYFNFDFDFKNLTAPLNIYFPDMAIYFDQAKKNIKLNSQTGLGRWINSGSNKEKSSVYENWIATAALYHIYPQLETLAENLSQQIITLPAEMARLKQAQKANSHAK